MIEISKEGGQLDCLNTTAGAIARELNQNERIEFTGFKARTNWPSYDLVTYWDEGLVAQWIDYRKHPEEDYYYVNMPGMQHGKCIKGDLFDIGTERIPLNASEDDLRRIIKTGYDKLREVRG